MARRPWGPETQAQDQPDRRQQGQDADRQGRPVAAVGPEQGKQHQRAQHGEHRQGLGKLGADA